MAYEILWRVHAFLMTTAFISMVAAVLISLIWKKRKWRYKTHRTLGIYAGVAGVTALLTAFVMVQMSHGYHLSSQHAIGGALTGLLLMGTPMVGLHLRRFKNKKIGKALHKSLGYLTLLGMGSSIAFGLMMVGLL